MIRFNPSGTLDLASDPSDLPSQSDGKNEVSGALRRCTNLDLDQPGLARTRRGSMRLNDAVVGSTGWRIVEMGGNRYVFRGTAIYRNGASIGSGYALSRWAAVKYNAYTQSTESIFASNGVNQVKVTGSTVTTWGIAAPTTAPTIQTGTDEQGQGDLTKVSVKYTYAEYDGDTLIHESNPSDATTQQATAGDPLLIQWTASTDSRVTHVRLYRTAIGGASHLHIANVAIGTTHYATSIPSDNGTDELGTEVETDNDVPGEFVCMAGPDFNGYTFGSAGDNKVYFSKAQKPESWPALYYVEVGPPGATVKELVLFGGQVYALTVDEIYQMQGTGVASFFPLRQTAVTGCASLNLALGVKGEGIYHVSKDGVYLFTGGVDRKVSDEAFEPLWRNESVENVPAVNRSNIATAFLTLWRNRLWFVFPGGGDALVTNLETKRTTHHEYPVNWVHMTPDVTNQRLLGLDSSGYAWVIDADVPADNGTAISWQIQSKDFSDQLRRYMPRYARWDVGLTSGSATGTVLLDGTSVQTHTITSRNPQKRLMAGDNGRRVALRISGTGVATVYSAEVE